MMKWLSLVWVDPKQVLGWFFFFFFCKFSVLPFISLLASPYKKENDSFNLLNN